MSRQIALDTIHLKKTPRWAHTEYSLEYHTDLIGKWTGNSKTTHTGFGKLYDGCGMDFLWVSNDGLHADWKARGRATDMGHAEYAADAGDKRETGSCPFKNEEDVWAFDPVKEYGLPDFNKQVSAYEEITAERRKLYPGQLSTGGYYKTIISGAIQSFGWDMLLTAATDEKKFERVLDGFFRYTMHHMKAWAQTSAEVIIQHDDFVWSNGPFMHPEFYRRAIIPRYAELWKPLHKAGKKVLFCSDAAFTMFTDDIAGAGADGFIFEPMNDFALMAEKYGSSHCLVGSKVDCVDLTLGKWEKVKSDIDDTFRIAEKCRGFIFAVGNHLPANVPHDIRDKYLAYLLEKLNQR